MSASMSYLYREPSSVEIGKYLAALRLDPCVYCGAPFAAVDHLRPRDKGGPNRYDNVVPACSFCNSSKGRASLMGFLLARQYEDVRQAAERVVAYIRTMRQI